ncbi:methyl-accepting chemotaxis protein [Salinibacillus kushneri]|uniref:Methyl-accepting chemotaxis protein n=1 Tax=Salinibacillus kushneri TaxID=237682 RepID=A0A1I0EPL9_9BACI|nr:methyl-accepting chemotaxis protein [Salinibacillus kushneri]SET47383.1 methyl-accepting chemotaxis protein [Salinibacillus kushneri]
MLKKLKFKNVNIGWKYGYALIIVFILFGAMTGVVSILVTNIDNNIDALERRGDRAIATAEMSSLTRSKGIRVLDFAETGDDAYLEEYENKREQFNNLEAELKPEMDTPELKELFEEIIANDKELNTLFTEEMTRASRQNDQVEVQNLSREADSIRSETVDLLQELKTMVDKERASAVEEVKGSAQLTLIVLIAAMIGAIIIGGLIVFFISRMVSRNLNKVVHVNNRVAEGNLAVDAIDYDGNDEIGKLAESTNVMGRNLKLIVEKITEISETVSSQSEELTQSANEVKAGSEQISSTMQELASGSESQANNASDLSSNASTFTKSVQEANANGEHVYESSKEVLNMTGEGQQLMEQSVKQMTTIDHIVQDAVQKVQGLDKQSKEISKLVVVIKDVAEQTNLLALNAAIEAARAGEHGQGFAVVADEVRKLAEQVADSVTDITEIVGKIQKESTNVVDSLQNGYSEVEKGTSQIKTTGETFDKINQAVSKMTTNIQTVTDKLSMMSKTNQEMSSSIEEIASISEEAAAGVEQTSASAEQTSSSMEEMASSSEDLAKLAEELNELIRHFKL